MAEPKNPPPEESSSVKFCAFAMIDLLGFSSHLEVSGYDLRTSVGKQAEERLVHLEDALEAIQVERANRSEYFPSGLGLRRINDAILVTLDLHDVLIPSVGGNRFGGLSADRLGRFVDLDKVEDLSEYEEVADRLMSEATEPLEKFLGLVARLYLRVNEADGRAHFPGAKAVVATGFRRPFLRRDGHDDQLSANFAFANAFEAEKNLRGAGFYVDNQIVELLCGDQYAKNLIRFGHFMPNLEPFNCFDDDSGRGDGLVTMVVPEPVRMELFRKPYVFRSLNPSPLTYLQQLSCLRPFLQRDQEPKLTNVFYTHILHAIEYGVGEFAARDLRLRPSFIFNPSNDLGVEVGIFREFIETGESSTQKAQHYQKQLKESGSDQFPDGHPARIAHDKLPSEETTIEIVTVDVEQWVPHIFEWAEEMVSGMLFLITGDLSMLDYPRPAEALSAPTGETD